MNPVSSIDYIAPTVVTTVKWGATCGEAYKKKVYLLNISWYDFANKNANTSQTTIKAEGDRIGCS